MGTGGEGRRAYSRGMPIKSALILAFAIAFVPLVSVAHAQQTSSRAKAPAAPVILSVTPSAARSDDPQMLIVAGTAFSGGLSVTVVAPDGKKRTYAGSAIQSQRETSFQMAVVLAGSGTYTFRVTNPNGAMSGVFVLEGPKSR